MDPLTALALANGTMQMVAYFVDLARAHGATPEQLAEFRHQAIARFDAAAAKVAAAEPPA